MYYKFDNAIQKDVIKFRKLYENIQKLIKTFTNKNMCDTIIALILEAYYE